MKAVVAAVLAASAPGVSAMMLRDAPKPATADPWPTMRGPILEQFGTTDVVVPKNLTKALAWKWNHPMGRYATNIAGGPVIDVEGNIYFTTNDGIRKLSPKGDVLWHHEQKDHRINNQPSLYDGKVYCSNQNGEAFALDQKDGTIVWNRKVANSNGGDAGYPAAHDGVFVVGADEGSDPLSPGGGNQILGLDSATGATLWSYRPSKPVWNFAPLFTKDGRAVFMDFSGGMYSVGLHNGTLQWHTPAAKGDFSFSDGGATLGPLDDVYSCSNPTGARGSEGTKGLIRRISVSDGKVLWERTLPQPCNSYPAVGKVGPGDELSVVVTPGSFNGAANMHGSLMAFDVKTGGLRWRFNTKAYNGPFFMAKGDVEGFAMRHRLNKGHDICLPAHWSSANIDGEGFAWAGRTDGIIYGVRAPPGTSSPQEMTTEKLQVNFESTPGLEVKTWNADGAPLHGAFAFAPGRMAFASCDTLYAFDA